MSGAGELGRVLVVTDRRGELAALADRWATMPERAEALAELRAVLWGCERDWREGGAASAVGES